MSHSSGRLVAAAAAAAAASPPPATAASPSSASPAAVSSATASPRPPRSSAEEPFLAVCREATKAKCKLPDTWQLLADAPGLRIYRLYDEKSGLYEYKIFGGIADCPPELCAEVYMDLHYRRKWDRYAKELCEKSHDGRTVTYWEVKFPFPMTNRDYVFTREHRDVEVDGRKIYVILSQSLSTSPFPEKPGVVRVKDYKQSVAIESDGKNGSKVYMSYFDNPGGKVPSWVVNWAAKSGVPNFFKDMQKACLSYQKKS